MGKRQTAIPACRENPVQTLRPLRTATLGTDGHAITATSQLNHDAEQILAELTPSRGDQRGSSRLDAAVYHSARIKDQAQGLLSPTSA